MNRRTFVVFLIAALVGALFGWMVFDYAETHGVSVQNWINNHDRKAPQ
jgi:uncharacterized membrane protein YdjX (TVP38/TMEM64 family)